MSLESVHQLHVFIFVLAITHVVFSALTMLLGGAKVTRPLISHMCCTLATEYRVL